VEAARPATEADLPRLAELCRRALAEMAPNRGGAIFVAREARAEPVDESLAAALRSPDHLVISGTLDDVVIGYAAARIEVLRTGDRLAVIDELYVEAEARAVGVGEAVMASVVEWAGSQRCVGIDAMALPGDRNTKNFFEMSGFTARLLVMHHRMP
jgi:GNAT superfamily N-acetyltransferase